MNARCSLCGHENDSAFQPCSHCRWGRPDSVDLSFPKLIAALENQPHEPGFDHPIDDMVALALETNPERALESLRRFCTSPLAPWAAAATLHAVGNVTPAPGTPLWRMTLVEAGLAHEDTGVRDATMSLLDARPEWAHCLPVLEAHDERVPYLAEYRRGIIADIQNIQGESHG